MIERLNKYRIMWVIVHFDLPTYTAEDKKAYNIFRKGLKCDGFHMLQYSMYGRHCSSVENAKVHKLRIKSIIPKCGEVIIFEITDSQFGRMEFYQGAKTVQKTNQVVQLTLF